VTRPALLSGALLVAVSVAGCSTGADATADYCAALEDRQQSLADLAQASGEPDADLFADGLAVFEALRAQAPGDLRDEWDTYVFAWQGVADAFERADARGIEDAAAGLRSDRVVEAGRGIEQHARDVCEVDLGSAGAASVG
jgi:hypothetical protein